MHHSVQLCQTRAVSQNVVQSPQGDPNSVSVALAQLVGGGVCASPIQEVVRSSKGRPVLAFVEHSHLWHGEILGPWPFVLG